MTACVREANGFDACVKTEDAGAQRTVARGLALLLSETLAPQGEFNGFAYIHLDSPPENARRRLVQVVPAESRRVEAQGTSTQRKGCNTVNKQALAPAHFAPGGEKWLRSTLSTSARLTVASR